MKAFQIGFTSHCKESGEHDMAGYRSFASGNGGVAYLYTVELQRDDWQLPLRWGNTQANNLWDNFFEEKRDEIVERPRNQADALAHRYELKKQTKGGWGNEVGWAENFSCPTDLFLSAIV